MSKYIDVKLDRLYLGYIADAREYIVEKAQKTGKGLRFYVRSTGRWIVVPHEKLSEGEMGNKIFKSKQKNSTHKTYRLVSFSVTPQEIKEKQKELKDQISVEQGLFGSMTLDRLAEMKSKLSFLRK